MLRTVPLGSGRGADARSPHAKPLRGLRSEATRPAVLFEEGEARPKWILLRVTDAKPVAEGADTGEVTFTATARTSQGAMRLTERSLFQRKDGRWVYVRALEPDEQI